MRNTTIKRYSGIESLRLLAMLGIVICHWGGTEAGRKICMEGYW